MTHGSLSIGKPSIRWSRAEVDAYLVMASIGVLAGLAVTYCRTPLHWPGHKVVLWMVPVLAGRLVTRTRAGASVGVVGLIVTTLVLGGQLGGGAVMMPLVFFAGVMLDAAAGIVERQKLSAWSALPLLALAGVAGNLICFIKRLFDVTGQVVSAGGRQELLEAAGSYAVFGVLAGVGRRGRRRGEFKNGVTACARRDSNPQPLA